MASADGNPYSAGFAFPDRLVPYLNTCLARFFSLTVLLTLLSGCDSSGPDSAPAHYEKTAAALPATEQGDQAPATDAAPNYLAERQFWVYEVPEAGIEARWQAHLKLCQAGCEVLAANLSKSAQAPVSAHLQLRIGRPTAARLLAAMGEAGIAERRIEREDKTMQVVDTEARLKNLTELRDRLRVLLATRNGVLKDVLETERELARVQGELDAMTAQRRSLANETEKILLFVDYRAAPALGETGVLRPLVEAWRDVGRGFVESLAAALLFIVQALPWLLIVLPTVWGIWRLIRRLFKRP